MTQTLTREIAPLRVGSQDVARLTFEQFLNWPGEDKHFEWVDGYVVEKHPVTAEHNQLTGTLICFIDEFVLLNNLGRMFHAPFLMKTGPNLPARAPDLMFVAEKHQARIKEYYVDGPADLVIEVLTAENAHTNTVVKFAEYEAGGVPEFWHFDLERQQASFFVLDANGEYQPVLPDADGIIRSTTIEGFWIKTEWLWRNPKPSVIEVLKAWGLI